MKLLKPIPPHEYVCAMRAGLAEFADPDDTAAAVLVRNHAAYEVFSLNLTQFSKPEDLETVATSVGWRFLTADPAGNLACHLPKSASPKIVAIARTSDVHVALNRLRELEERCIRKPSPRWQRVPNLEFELRGLRIPSLLLEGVWLHRPKQRPRDTDKRPRDTDTDFLVPCLGFAKAESDNWGWNLELLEPYSPQEFLEPIRDAAAYRLKRQKTLYP